MNMQEHARTIFGVEGRAFARHTWPNKPLWSTQTWGATRYFEKYGKKYRITVDMRFDDSCRNGHHTFAMTGEVRESPYVGYRSIVTCGAIHDDIAKHFPELAPLLKWHLTSTDGPMHYIANTVYMASGEGKARELNHARSAAVWPDATDAELMQEPEALKAVLAARLPALLSEFRGAMDACGFAWEAPQS